MRRSATLSFLGIAAIPFGTAQAQLFDSYGVVKQRHFVQTSASEPTTPVAFYSVLQLADIDSLTAANVGTATAAVPGLGAVPLTNFIGPGAFVVDFGGPFASEAALNLAAPGGQYSFSITGGAFGDQSGLLDQPSQNFWTSVPSVINYSDLASVDPAATLVIELNDFIQPVSAAGYQSFFVAYNLIRVDSSAVVSESGWAPDGRNISIPGGTLTPGAYRLNLTYSADLGEDLGAFGGALAVSSFTSSTALDITVVPAPATLWLTSLAFTLRRSRKQPA